MATESGYSNQKKLGKAQYKTIQSVGSDKFGVNTAQMYLFDVTPSPIAITAVTVDSDDENKLWLEITAHGARENDVVRFTDNADALFGWELEVIEVLDANTLAVHKLPDVLPSVTDNVKICRWITAKADSEGALTTSSGPVQYLRNGATQTVVEDTVTPANNRPLPAGLYIIKDGMIVPVTKDTGIPSNSVGIPVELVAASGTPINITAGDINVQLSDQGVNFDSLRVGDGSGVYLKINADQSINVVDSAVAAKLDTLLLTDFSTEAKQDDIITAIGNLLNELQLKADLTETQPVSAASLPLPTGAATEGTLSTLNGKIPTIGQKTMAGSIPVVLPSDQSLTITATGIATETKQDAEIALIGALNASPVSNPSAPSASLLELTRGMLQLLTSVDTRLTTIESVPTPNYQEDLTVTTTVETITAPAGAKWCKIMTKCTDGDMRVKIGGVASATSGMKFQDGRSEDFQVAGNISYRMESGTGEIYVVFGV